VSAEPPLEKVKEPVTVEGTEEVAIKEVRREPSSLPWKAEAESSEIERRETFPLRIGMPEVSIASGSRGEGYHEECYPGVVENKEVVPPTKFQKPAPPGCVRVDLIIDNEAGGLHLEQLFQGTLRTKVVNGGGNCLNPSRGEIKEAEASELESTVGTLKLSSAEGQQLPQKACGFRNAEGLTLGGP
jgi:hypothetical protein